MIFGALSRHDFSSFSDTHGLDFDQPIQQYADVAIHCGDLTDGSKLAEFESALEILKNIKAPLKLVIAGNHDFTMDLDAFERKVNEAIPPLDLELVAEEYGIPGEARKLFDDAKEACIVFLDEGNHTFTLQNGATLNLYASPYTPALGAWGFQYNPNRGHDFDIQPDVDIVVTHGPPNGIMDYTHGHERAGCSQLFEAVAKSQPKIHCFGHIHEGWGARLVSWKDECGDHPTHFTAINNDRSSVVEKLANLKPSRFDTEQDRMKGAQKLEKLEMEGCYITSHCSWDELPLEQGRTMFINASCCDREGKLGQRPWLVDIELHGKS